MRVPRVFSGAAASGQGLFEGAELLLDESASRRLARVLRLAAGAPLIVFDGRGGECDARIERVASEGVVVRLCAPRKPVPLSGLDLRLGLAVTRGERMDWAVQKTVELGATAIAPLLCERSDPHAAKPGRIARWRKIARSACEQCGRSDLARVDEFVALPKWLACARAEGGVRLVLRADAPASELPRSASLAWLLSGPEGGLSAEELNAAAEAGFAAWSLGPRVLRAETAPLVSLALLQARWGDLAPTAR